MKLFLSVVAIVVWTLVRYTATGGFNTPEQCAAELSATEVELQEANMKMELLLEASRYTPSCPPWHRNKMSRYYEDQPEERAIILKGNIHITIDPKIIGGT